ncbi:MAG: large repetitive protein, partial [Miltoncostaeaceae bacterium]|nr:large repetitive protein [Miltoncostaeaceae bacterium]
SNAELGQFGPGSPQYEWLANDLQTNTQPCVLAYFHHPRFNIGQEGMGTRMDPVWALLAQSGVDLVVNGHDHSYQRWEPLDAAGAPSPAGTTEIVVGTGGHALQNFVQSDPRVAAASSKQFGALRLELNPAGAAFRFMNTDGVTLDSGSVACHAAAGGSPDAAAPTAPTGLQASAPSRSQIRLSWTVATDNVGVTGYDVYRDGALLANAGPEGAYTDATPSPGTTHTYEVAARDAAGNVSARSAPASAATDPVALLFSDGFESGGLGGWSSVNGLSVGQSQVFSGANAARATSTGSPAWASRTVAPQDQLYYQLRFKVLDRGATSSVNLLSFDSSAGTRLATLSLSNGGRLAITGITTGGSNPLVSEDVWHTVQVRFLSSGASSQSEVWLDGARIALLSGTIAAGGSGQIAAIEVGDGVAGRSFDVAYDDVAVDPQQIADVIAPSAPTGLTATAASGLEIDLAWQAAADDVGVTGYDVYRDCSPASGDPGCAAIASVGGSSTAYADTAVSPLSSHFYVVVARDGGGNASLPSNVASADTPVVFSDGFESGNLARWTTVQGLVASSAPVNAGSFAARATSAGSGSAFAVKTLGGGLTEIYARVRFRVASQGANQVTLLRLATAAGTPLVTLALSPTARLLSQNGPAATTATSAITVAPGAWHELQVHLLVAGSSGRSDVWLDGSQVAALGGTASFGTTPAARLQIGEDAPSGKTYDVAFDEVLADTSFIVDTTPPSAPTGLTAGVGSGGGVDLAWQPASDNLAVTGYDVFRNGTQIASVGTVTSFRDATVAPSTAYTYRVSAADAGGNTSAQSAPASVTTSAPITTTQTLTPSADAYTNAGSTGSNYGAVTTLKVDATPLMRSYLRFSVSGLTGPPASATLRVWATSGQPVGYDAFAVADTSWLESAISDANAPAFGAKLGSSGAATAGAWTSVNVTPLIT